MGKEGDIHTSKSKRDHEKDIQQPSRNFSKQAEKGQSMNTLKYSVISLAAFMPFFFLSMSSASLAASFGGDADPWKRANLATWQRGHLGCQSFGAGGRCSQGDAWQHSTGSSPGPFRYQDWRSFEIRPGYQYTCRVGSNSFQPQIGIQDRWSTMQVVQRRGRDNQPYYERAITFGPYREGSRTTMRVTSQRSGHPLVQGYYWVTCDAKQVALSPPGPPITIPNQPQGLCWKLTSTSESHRGRRPIRTGSRTVIEQASEKELRYEVKDAPNAMTFSFKIEPIGGSTLPEVVCAGRGFIVEVNGRSWGNPGGRINWPQVIIDHATHTRGFNITWHPGWKGPSMWGLKSNKNPTGQDTGSRRYEFTPGNAGFKTIRWGFGLNTGTWFRWTYTLIK